MSRAEVKRIVLKTPRIEEGATDVTSISGSYEGSGYQVRSSRYLVKTIKVGAEGGSLTDINRRLRGKRRTHAQSDVPITSEGTE